jgi:chromosome segregation ATPase
MDAMRKKIGVNDSQAPASKELLQKAKLAESLQREVQSLHQQMAKKSSAAQKLLQQRESDCHELKSRIKALQQELDKGSFSDRRIFELAAQQSSRESIASSEIEVRNQMVERLTHTLEVNDDNLALAELNAKLQAGQVEELCRIHRREDVNLDYLKATIVQYLSKPPGSSERAALLPVIATLLQFDDEDYKIIEAGKNKVSWFGSVMPTFITAPVSEEIKPKTPAKQNGDATPLLASTSAEVKVSRPPEDAAGSSGRRKGTSLQF